MKVSSPVIAVGGPTGSGKSAIALQLATEFRGEIINYDSMQIYRHFDIGTAKLPQIDRAGIPHYLLDVAEASEGFTAGEFARQASTILAQVTERRKLPILVGGTGFYLRALLEGLSPSPPADQALRAGLKNRDARRPGALHRILRRLHPDAAKRIHPNDLPKLIRAVELRVQSGERQFVPAARTGLEGHRTLKLGLFPPREELYAALDRRCSAMLSGGLIEEIQGILALGISPSAKPFQSLGYKEGLALLEGRLSRGEALAGMQRDTRRYAKRQMTWFRNEPGMVILLGFGTDPEIAAAARSHVSRFLSGAAA